MPGASSSQIPENGPLEVKIIECKTSNEQQPKPESTPNSKPITPQGNELMKLDRRYISKWIDHVESIAKQIKWDVFKYVKEYCKDAEVSEWLDQQDDDNKSWENLKKDLRRKYDLLEKVNILQDFVCTFRQPGERLLDYYYEKMKIGKKLALREDYLMSVIIHRVNDKSIEDGALNRVQDVDSLLDYFKIHSRCSICHKPGHLSVNCFKKRPRTEH